MADVQRLPQRQHRLYEEVVTGTDPLSSINESEQGRLAGVRHALSPSLVPLRAEAGLVPDHPAMEHGAVTKMRLLGLPTVAFCDNLGTES